jgi:hypothetical protein
MRLSVCPGLVSSPILSPIFTFPILFRLPSLRAGRSGDRIPVGGEIFRSRSYRPWGPPSLLYNGYCVFPGGKAAGAWRWPPTPSSAEVKESVDLYLFFTSGPSWLFLGRTLPLPLPLFRLPYDFTHNGDFLGSRYLQKVGNSAARVALNMKGVCEIWTRVTNRCVYPLNCYFIAGCVPEEAKEKVVILGYNWTEAICT